MFPENFPPEVWPGFLKILECEYRHTRLEYRELELKLQAGQVVPEQNTLSDLKSRLELILRRMVVIERAGKM